MVKKDGLILRYVTNQTLELCHCAVEQNKDALIFVNKEKFPEVYIYHKLLYC